MKMRARLATPVIAFLGLLFAAPSASAYDVVGEPWPDDKITYWVSASEYKAEVQYAAKKWNSARVGIVFRQARTRQSADVVVARWDDRCGGAAYAGYVGPRSQSRVLLGQGCGDDRLVALVATHELGHVLGLGHEEGTCALMNPTFDGSGTPGECNRHPLDFWFERPLRGDDIRGAKSLYR